LVNTVPLFPAAATPMASPWRCGGYQRLASGRATAKDAPAVPSSRPTPISIGSDPGSSQPAVSGRKSSASRAMPTRLLPIRSLSRPTTTRVSEPLSSGIATTSPFCAGVRCTLSAMKIPSAPSSTQSMKLRSKCRKQAISVGRCPFGAAAG